MTIVFKYKKIDRPKPLPSSFSPMIPITLKHKSKTLDVLGLLDSGADTTALPKEIAEILDIDLSGEREPVVGIGDAEAITSKVEIVIQYDHERRSIPVEIKVILGDKEDFPVLIGRSGFFDAFHITFKESEKRVVLKKVDGLR